MGWGAGLGGAEWTGSLQLTETPALPTTRRTTTRHTTALHTMSRHPLTPTLSWPTPFTPPPSACCTATADPARKFDQRLSGLVKAWPAPTGGGTRPLWFTTSRTFSAEPDLRDCPPGTNAASVASSRRQLAGQQGGQQGQQGRFDLESTL